MLEAIPVTQARRDFLPSIERVANKLHKFVVTKRGKPMTVVLSYQEYTRMVETLKLFEDERVTRDKICAIVLAAGKADYGNTPMQLFPVDGVPLISRVTEALLTSGIDDLIVVLGYQAEQVKKELASKDIKVVVNPNYERGLSRSLRYGLRMVSRDAAAVVLTPGNRPFIKPEVVGALIKTYQRGKAVIVVPTCHQIRGHPVIFNASLVPELLKTRGDVGGREVIRRHQRELIEVEVEDAGIFKKIES